MGPGAARRERLWWTSEHTEHIWVLPELPLKTGSLELLQDNGQRVGLRSSKHRFSFSSVVLNVSTLPFACSLGFHFCCHCWWFQAVEVIIPFTGCHWGNEICVHCYWGLPGIQAASAARQQLFRWPAKLVRWQYTCSSALETEGTPEVVQLLHLAEWHALKWKMSSCRIPLSKSLPRRQR